MDYTMKKQSSSLAATDLTFGCIFVVHDSNLLHLLKHKLLVQCLLTWSKQDWTGNGPANCQDLKLQAVPSLFPY